jgi:autotransporter-associated beta strand protein
VFVLDGPNTVETFNTSLQISRGGGNGTVINQNGATMNIGTGSAAQNIQIESEPANNSHGTFKVTGGTVNIGQVGSTTAIGMIWLNKGGSQLGSTAVFTQSGGTVNAWGGVLIGAPSGTFNGGTSAFTNSGGFLYIGSGGSIGISRGAVFAPTNYFVLSGGTVGAMASWTSKIPMQLDTLNGNITFQASDAFNDSFNISLSGPLTGAGGLNKTGGGMLTLSGANNFAGSVVISNGTLTTVTTLAPVNGPVTLDGSQGSPISSVSVTAAGQTWTVNGDLTYTNGTPTQDFNYGTFGPSTTVAPITVNGNVNLDVQPQFTVEGSAIPVGTYPLIKYTGTVAGTLPTPTALPSGATGVIMNDTANKVISLVVTSSSVTANLSWRVGSGTWDFTTPNWTLLGSAADYTEPNAVIFDDTATGPFPITVTLNTTVQPTSIIALTTNGYTITGNGAITGSASITKSGSGFLTLTGSNTYSGGTTVASGQLNINFGGDGTNLTSAIGTGPLTNALGAEIDNTSGHSVTMLTSVPEFWNDDWTFLGSSSFNTGPGAIALGSSVVTLTVSSNVLEVDGTISDNGNNYKLLKTGAGALTLRVDNNFGGGTEINAGTLNLGSGGSVGSGILTIDGGAIDNVSGSDLTLFSPAAINISIASGGTFTFLGSGNLDLGSSTINPNNGTLMYWNIVSNILSTDGTIASGNTTITKIGAGTLVIGGSGTGSQFSGIVNQGEVDLQRSFGISVGTGGQGLLVQSNGIVKITDSSGNQISDGNYIQTRLNAGGVLDLNGNTETLDMLSMTNGVLRNSAVGATAILTVATNANSALAGILTLTGTSNVFDVPDSASLLQIAGTLYVNGTGGLIKTGAGTAEILVTNEYGGDTTVSNGTLIIHFPTLTNTSTINISGTNSILNLAFPNGETNTVSALVINGVAKPNGIYNATTDPNYISGSGSLQVIPAINPLPGPIQFTATGGGTTLGLSWPTNMGWVLQSQTNATGIGIVPGSTNWFTVTGSASLTSTNLPIDPTKGSVFYRLHHP